MTDQRIANLKRMLAQIDPTLRADGLEAARSGPEGGLESLSHDPMAGQETQLALESLDVLRSDNEIDQDNQFALEAIVMPYHRPVIDIVGGSMMATQLTNKWRHLNEGDIKPRLETIFRSIGRIEIPEHQSLPYAGTGFVVGQKNGSHILMTNRHVAAIFADGVGISGLDFVSGQQADIDFLKEYGRAESASLDIVRVLMIHPYWDMALLEVTGLPNDRQPLKLFAEDPTGLQGRQVAAIGYPGYDPRGDNNYQSVQNRIFRGTYYVKRMQPGEFRVREDVRSYERIVSAVTHDCSTLGGNSGSAVVDVQTGNVLGLHFAGAYLRANYAVSPHDLAQDQKVVDAGLEWTGNMPSTSSHYPPIWRMADPDVSPPDTGPGLQGEDGAGEGSPPIPPGGSDGSSAEAAGIRFGNGWYERIDDAELVRAYARSPETVKQELIGILGQAEALDLCGDIRDALQLHTEMEAALEAGQEGLFGTRPDPDLPEIILLHGIMGGHLAHAGFFRNRIWLDPKELVKGNIAERLSLQSNGFSDSNGMRIEPDGQMKMKYNKAARKWRKARFRVHQFAYDWRKGVHFAAIRLNNFIEERVQENSDARFVLVAHSMGGLVSSIYSHRFPNWQDSVEQAIFVGSPLGGSYAVPLAVTGQDPFIGKLAYWSRNDDHPQFASMARGFPGLIDMLPHPSLFPEGAPLYRTSGWPQDTSPLTRWLTQSHNLKTLLQDSPILHRTNLFVSLSHGTLGEMTLQNGQLVAGPETEIGDGTVHHKSSLVDGVPAFKAQHKHGDLMNDPLVIAGVVGQIKDGSPGLPPVSDGDLEGTLPVPVTESLESVSDASLETARSRFESGTMTLQDLQKLSRW